MNTYLDQIGHQEIARQYLDKISQASMRTSAVRNPRLTNRHTSDHSALSLKSKSRLAIIIATIILAALVISEALAAITIASGGVGLHLVR
jgi:hypothetical protein